MYNVSSRKTTYGVSGTPVGFGARRAGGQRLASWKQGARRCCALSFIQKRVGHIFTYDGPIDDQFYSMENALGVSDLELPDDQGRYKLRDLAQGLQLDAALKLTVKPQGKKRTVGEQLVAREAQREREQPAWDVAPASKKARKAPTKRVPS